MFDQFFGGKCYWPEKIRDRVANDEILEEL